MLAHFGNIFTLKEHLTGGRLGQAHDGATRSGLTATRLTNQTKGLTRINLKRDVVYSRDDALGKTLGEHAGLCGELFREVLDLQ